MCFVLRVWQFPRVTDRGRHFPPPSLQRAGFCWCLHVCFRESCNYCSSSIINDASYFHAQTHKSLRASLICFRLVSSSIHLSVLLPFFPPVCCTSVLLQPVEYQQHQKLSSMLLSESVKRAVFLTALALWVVFSSLHTVNVAALNLMLRWTYTLESIYLQAALRNNACCLLHSSVQVASVSHGASDTS